jgi:hypothetical protein
MPIEWAFRQYEHFNNMSAYGDILQYVSRYRRLDAVVDLTLSSFENYHCEDHSGSNRYDPAKREGYLDRQRDHMKLVHRKQRKLKK